MEHVHCSIIGQDKLLEKCITKIILVGVFVLTLSLRALLAQVNWLIITMVMNDVNQVKSEKIGKNVVKNKNKVKITLKKSYLYVLNKAKLKLPKRRNNNFILSFFCLNIHHNFRFFIDDIFLCFSLSFFP